MKKSGLLLLSTLLLVASLTIPAISKKEKDGDDPNARAQWFIKPRLFGGVSELEARQKRLKALDQTDQMVSAMKSGKGSRMQAEQPQWTQIGPFNVGGRIKSIAVNPIDTSIIYIGAAAGGVWKSTDGGGSWKPIMDFQNSIAMGALAIDPKDPNVIYAGTGEAVPGGGNIFLGAGIFKSIDAGETWSLSGLASVGAFSKIYVHPTDSKTVIASATNPNGGLYISVDGGASWNSRYPGQVTDVTIDPANSRLMMIGVNSLGIFKTTDGGSTWEKKNDNLIGSIGRISIMMTPVLTSNVYCLVNMDGKGQIFRSQNGGDTWTSQYGPDTTFFNGQGHYNNFLEAHPTDPKRCIAGGIDLYLTTNGGTLWMNVTHSYSGGKTHPDQQCGAFNPKNPKIIYFGNDGGFYRTNDEFSNVYEFSEGLAITQFYRMAVNQRVEMQTMGGTQDNGTLADVDVGSDWATVGGADGFWCIFDHGDPNTIYTEIYYGDMRKTDLATGQTIRVVDGIPLDDAGAWSSPLIQDPVENRTLYHGRRGLYMSFDGADSWVNSVEKIDGIYQTRLSSQLTALAVSPVDQKIVYGGTGNGEIIVTSVGGGVYTSINKNGIVSRPVNDIVCSRKQAQTAYVCLNGFGTGHVYRTTDLGASWADVSKGLPDVPANCIELDPENELNLYVGTDVGVFASFDGGETWISYGVGLPRSPVLDLELHRERKTLRCATHGRSMWEVALAQTDYAQSNQGVTAPTGGEVFASAQQIVVSWTGFKESVTVDYTISDGKSWSNIGTNVFGSRLSWILPRTNTERARVRITGKVSGSDVIVYSNTFAIEAPKYGAVMKESGVALTPYGLALDGKGGLWTSSFYTPRLTKLNATTLEVLKSVTIVDGDSMYTDLSFDRTKGLIYLHKIRSAAAANGGFILVLDTNGNELKRYPSPADRYPIGMEFVDGKLYVGDRDSKKVFVVNPANGIAESSFDNAVRFNYGPRSLCYDSQGQMFYQASTDFTGNSLVAAYAIKFSKANPTVEAGRIVLQSRIGSINTRGIEYDPSDKNIFVSDFSGSIYKIAGFESDLSFNPVIDDLISNENIIATLSPNPASSMTVLTVTPKANCSSARIRLLDIRGREIKTVFLGELKTDTIETLSIDCAPFVSGTYYVEYQLGTLGSYTQRLVITK